MKFHLRDKDSIACLRLAYRDSCVGVPCCHMEAGPLQMSQVERQIGHPELNPQLLVRWQQYSAGPEEVYLYSLALLFLVRNRSILSMRQLSNTTSGEA